MDRDVVNDLVKTVENLKISTLVNAAKISPLVQERTIGPKQTNGLNYHQHEKNLTNNSINSKSSEITCNGTLSKTITIDNGKFRKDVWREVNLDSENDETPKNLLQLNDCKAISFRLAANNAERQRRAKISTDLQQKQNQWDSELEQRLQLIRIDSAEKQKKMHAKRLEREKLTLDAIEKFEEKAKQDEINSNLKNTEMIEHNRKLIEHANHLKRQDELRLLLESINASKNLFISLFEFYAKTIINDQHILNQTGKLGDYTKKRDSLLHRYEKVINSINSKTIVTIADTELFEELCMEIKEEQNELITFIQSSKESMNTVIKTQATNEIIAKNANETLRVTNLNEISVTDGNSNKPAIPVTNNNSGAEDRIAKYYELVNYYYEYKNQIQSLIENASMKKFLFNCQRGVNTPVNSISAVSPEHLQV